MHGDLLDVILAVLAVLAAVAGYRSGLIAAVTAFIGFLAGIAVGLRLAPRMAALVFTAPTDVLAVDRSVAQRAVTVVLVLVFAAVGHALGRAAGARLRAKVDHTRFTVADGIGGAVISAASMLTLAWLVGIALAYAPAPAVARQIHRSVVLQTIDEAVPSSGERVASSLLREMQRHDLPAVTGPFATLLAPSVPDPDPDAVPAAVSAAGGSVLKIVGTAPSCSRRIEGSGFVYATDLIVTNAHVVAGVIRPEVRLADRALSAQVVLYDPDRDVAVLRAPGLDRAPLAMAGQTGTGADAVIAGYPQDGPFTAVPARIAARTDVSGPNIYHTRTVTRQVYTVRGQVLPGNSGGPLLDAEGKVYGMVFAASVDQSEVGYALTAAEIATDLAAGRSATAPVGTGGCD